MNTCIRWGLAGLLWLLGSVSAGAQPIKIAYIEVLSGTMGNVGELAGKPCPARMTCTDCGRNCTSPPPDVPSQRLPSRSSQMARTS